MPLVDAAASVLVVIDVQEGFVDAPGAEDAIAHVAWLAAVATALGVPAVVTEEEPERNGPTDRRVLERLPSRTPVLPKPTFGLAGTPHILDAVRATGRTTAVLTGFETDVCVAQSAIGLLGEGFDVAVVDDATSSPGAMHEAGLRRAVGAGATRVHTKGLAYEWLRTIAAFRALLDDRPDLRALAPFPL